MNAISGNDPDQSNIPLNLLSGISIGIISAAVIFLQIVFMRSLSITRYHHFSYLIISSALLGFGASGTFLSFFSDRMKKRFEMFSSLFILLFLVSTPICYVVAEHIPLDINYILYSGKQLLMFSVYNVLIFIPFFCGAVVIGFALVYFERSIPTVYGVNLLGSGAGGVMAIGALFLFPATRLPVVVSVVSLLALILWIASSRKFFDDRLKRYSFTVLITGIVSTLLFLFIRPAVHIDQYKLMSHLERLETQGEAQRVSGAFSPRAQIDVYDSKRLHYTMFAGLNADTLPPPQLAVLVDGQYAGSVFTIRSIKDARILDFTPQSVPYRMTDSPRVLLLGETGGVNMWLAKRFGAERITVVQPDPKLNDIMMSEVSSISGGIYTMEGVQVISKEPYLFLEQTDELFDIIQIVTAEGMSAGGSGLQSLHEDYMLTVESIAKCYRRLTDSGFLSITRGVQSPPRDNIKIFALFGEALARSGIKDINMHVLQSRNYLAVNTLLSKRPLSPNDIEQYRDVTKELLMDDEYYPGIRSDDITQLNVIQGPENEPFSYYHYGAMKLLSDERERFFDEWVYSVIPPTDDRPYFYDFFRWRSIGGFIEHYGQQWLQRLELGYVVLVFAFTEIVIIAILFIIVPLFFTKTRIRGERGKLSALLYFLCLGFGFMFIEMVFIQKFTRFMGSPVYSVSVALTSILVCAGLGSLFQQKREGNAFSRVTIAVIGILTVSVMYLIFLDALLSSFISYSVAVRFIITALLLAPVSFFMGWMFPIGMTLIERNAVNLVPWAWGVNGFASVSAAPLAVMLSMSFGFRAVIVMALLLYLMAGSVAGRLNKGIV